MVIGSPEIALLILTKSGIIVLFYASSSLSALIKVIIFQRIDQVQSSKNHLLTATLDELALCT